MELPSKVTVPLETLLSIDPTYAPYANSLSRLMYLRNLFMSVTIRYIKIPGLEFQKSAVTSVSISEERLHATHHFVKLLSLFDP